MLAKPVHVAGGNLRPGLDALRDLAAHDGPHVRLADAHDAAGATVAALLRHFQLLADGGADPGCFGLLGERGGGEIAAGLLAAGAGFSGFAGHGGMEAVDDALGLLTGFVGQLEIGGMGDAGGRAGGIGNEPAVGIGRGWRLRWRAFTLIRRRRLLSAVERADRRTEQSGCVRCG